MKNALRCCISCILPCGVLDVIRIVHTNGRVEEITGDVTAAEIMKMHPKHILKKPSSRSVDDQATCPKIVVVPPEAQLKRGKIYFLIPVLSPPEKPRQKSSSTKKKRPPSSSEVEQKRSKQSNTATGVVVSDQYLSEILSEKLSTAQRDRRRGRVGVWRPHLESISETASES